MQWPGKKLKALQQGLFQRGHPHCATGKKMITSGHQAVVVQWQKPLAFNQNVVCLNHTNATLPYLDP